MSKNRTKKIILIFSFICLWGLETIKIVEEKTFYHNSQLAGDISEGFGSAIFLGFTGIVVGGFVLFNIFLFFYNLIKPENNLNFSIIDKIIAGLITAVIWDAYTLIKMF